MPPNTLEDAGTLAFAVRKLIEERRASLSASDVELLRAVLTFLKDVQPGRPPLSRTDLIALGGEVARLLLDVLLGT